MQKKEQILNEIVELENDINSRKNYKEAKTISTAESLKEDFLLEAEVKEEKPKSEIKNMFLLLVLNFSIWSALIMNSICLQNIGISNIVINSFVMTCGDFISNLLIFLFYHKLERKKNLIKMYSATFMISLILFILSLTPDSTTKNISNLVLSFFLKINFMLTLVLFLLFSGNYLKTKLKLLPLKTEAN